RRRAHSALHDLERALRRLPALRRLVQRGLDEALEERMAVHGPRLELGMRLRRDEPGMVLELDHLDEPAVRRRARADEPRLLELLAIGVVELVAMPVALEHLTAPVELAGQRAVLEGARIVAEPH